MLRLTNLADYAVLLVCEIAKDKEKRYSAQELSETTSLPVTTVAKILNILSKAGVLTSFRGLKGGFSLAGLADDLSLIEVIEAVDGPVQMTHCADTDSEDCCDYTNVCGVRPHWRLINQNVRASLSQITLAQVMAPIGAAATLEHDLEQIKKNA